MYKQKSLNESIHARGPSRNRTFQFQMTKKEAVPKKGPCGRPGLKPATNGITLAYR